LPEWRRGEAKEFLKVLVTVSALTPTLLFLSVLMPMLGAVFTAFWAFSLSLDLHTTWRFYKQNPGQFRSMERNRIFSLLAEKLGFPAAAAAFITLVEIPFAAFLTLILVSPAYTYLCRLNAEPVACTSVGLAVIGSTHLQAAVRNLRTEMRRGNNRVSNGLPQSDCSRKSSF
jgi:hypothetical protein